MAANGPEASSADWLHPVQRLRFRLPGRYRRRRHSDPLQCRQKVRCEFTSCSDAACRAPSTGGPGTGLNHHRRACSCKFLAVFCSPTKRSCHRLKRAFLPSSKKLASFAVLRGLQCPGTVYRQTVHCSAVARTLFERKGPIDLHGLTTRGQCTALHALIS